ncbi:MAG TPA: aspartyl protease family protein, partial [Rubrobacter sp.]|nr:aspartyl protease family protein [Rubrobacter sp.]
DIESQRGSVATDVFLVDTGSYYSAISPELRDRLELPHGWPTQIMLADGRVIDTEVVLLKMRLMDREAIVPVEIVGVPEPLLGVTGLEGLGLKVDPVTRTLELERQYGPPASFTRFRP